VKRSLIPAMAVALPAGAAVLGLPVWGILIAAATELAALVVLRVTQVQLQREAYQGALKILRAMDSKASVSIEADGSLSVWEHLPPCPHWAISEHDELESRRARTI
jgi:hypothetical protein